MLQKLANANEHATASQPSLTLCRHDNAILILQLQEAALQARCKADRADAGGQHDMAQVYRTMADARERAATRLMEGRIASSAPPRPKPLYVPSVLRGER